MKNYNRNNHRHFGNRGIQRYHTPRPPYDPNHIKIKRDGSYEGNVKNLDHALGAMGLLAGILAGLSYLFKSKFNDSEDKRKEAHEKKMSNIRVNEYREMSNIRVDEFLRKHPIPPQPTTPPKNPYVEDAEVIEEMPASSDASTSVPTDGISSDELFNKRPKAIRTNWIVDGYMKVELVNYLVAGAGVGKSILATQIALAVDKGIRPEFLPPTCSESAKLDVVYYRMEDFSCELEDKYGDGEVLRNSGIEWVLSEHLKEFSLNGLLEHIKAKAGNLKGDTLFEVDPLTKVPGWKHDKFISGVEEAQKIAKANGHTLTILVIVHSYEIKNSSVLTSCDIKGGDTGIGQAGSVTAMLQERSGVKYRFLKCLKDPKGSSTPFDGKVLVMKMEETQLNAKNKYVHFVHVGFKEEAEALPLKTKAKATAPVTPNVTAPAPQKTAPNQKVTSEMEQKMMDMLAKGMKPSSIAKKLHLSEKTVRRYKKDFNAKKTD